MGSFSLHSCSCCWQSSPPSSQIRHVDSFSSLTSFHIQLALESQTVCLFSVPQSLQSARASGLHIYLRLVFSECSSPGRIATQGKRRKIWPRHSAASNLQCLLLVYKIKARIFCLPFRTQPNQAPIFFAQATLFYVQFGKFFLVLSFLLNAIPLLFHDSSKVHFLSGNFLDMTRRDSPWPHLFLSFTPSLLLVLKHIIYALYSPYFFPLHGKSLKQALSFPSLGLLNSGYSELTLT